MKIKSLLRFVLLLACLTIGVETYAEAEGTIEIQLISKKGLVFPFDPGFDDKNTYILSSGTTESDSLRILATAGGHPLELKESAGNGITINFGDSLVSLIKADVKPYDGSYYIVTAAAADFNDTNYKNTITFEYSNYAPRTIKFEVDNTTIIDFSNTYIGGVYDEDRIGVIGSATIGVSILNPRNGEFVNLEEGKDYTVGYSSSDSLVAEISGNMVGFKKESTSVTLTATLTLNNHNYACPRGTYNDVFKVVAPVTLKNTEKGYLATFSSIHNRDFSDTGIDVYIVEAIDGNKAKLTRVADNIVNAGEGVLLYSTSEKTDVVAPIAVSASETSYEGNLLKATGANEQIVNETEDGANNYILQNQEGHLAFYKATGKKMKANHAYLQFPQTTAGVRSLELNFDDETTGISEISTDTDSQAVYYNLGGQRISQPRKGSIFVKNGKKIVR